MVSAGAWPLFLEQRSIGVLIFRVFFWGGGIGFGDQRRYNWWVRWSRIGVIINACQLAAAMLLTVALVRSEGEEGSTQCFQIGGKWKGDEG